MGVFDSVYLTCPACGEKQEIQSKADEGGEMATYHNEAPAVIAGDIGLRAFICSCGVAVQVRESRYQTLMIPLKLVELARVR